jgi:CBS domain-containing protein
LKQLQVKDAMTTNVETIAGRERIDKIFEQLEQRTRYLHSYPIVDNEQKLIGICTFNDLKRALAAGKRGATARAIASKKLEFVHPHNTLDAATLKMGKRSVSQLPVVDPNDAGRLVGILTMGDIARALAAESDDGAGTEADESCSTSRHGFHEGPFVFREAFRFFEATGRRVALRIIRDFTSISFVGLEVWKTKKRDANVRRPRLASLGKAEGCRGR